jgi:hypothetical protein
MTIRAGRRCGAVRDACTATPLSLAAACLVLFVACASPTQLYPGPARPPGEVAILVDRPDASVLSINGLPTSGTAWSLLPGAYKVLVKMRIHHAQPNVRYHVYTYCWIAFQAVAGEEYGTRVRLRSETASGVGERLKIEMGIVDRTDELIAIPATCSQKRPSLGS